MTVHETIPRYGSLNGVVQILSDARESPRSWAHLQLEGMKVDHIDWNALHWERPNSKARTSALKVLKAAHAIRPVEPSYVTPSAEGGIGIVYKSAQRYAALECLNNGRIWLLWYDTNGDPQSREVKNRIGEINAALREISALHANA